MSSKHKQYAICSISHAYATSMTNLQLPLSPHPKAEMLEPPLPCDPFLNRLTSRRYVSLELVVHYGLASFLRIYTRRERRRGMDVGGVINHRVRVFAAAGDQH